MKRQQLADDSAASTAATRDVVEEDIGNDARIENNSTTLLARVLHTKISRR